MTETASAAIPERLRSRRFWFTVAAFVAACYFLEHDKIKGDDFALIISVTIGGFQASDTFTKRRRNYRD